MYMIITIDKKLIHTNIFKSTFITSLTIIVICRKYFMKDGKLNILAMERIKNILFKSLLTPIIFYGCEVCG